MLKGITENGELKNVKVSENGEILTKRVEQEVKEIETTLQAGVITVGTEATTIAINKKVTVLSIANYSETADITVTAGEKSYTIGSNLALDLPINGQVTDISVVSSEEDTKLQYVIKGVE